MLDLRWVVIFRLKFCYMRLIIRILKLRMNFMEIGIVLMFGDIS